MYHHSSLTNAIDSRLIESKKFISSSVECEFITELVKTRQ